MDYTNQKKILFSIQFSMKVTLESRGLLEKENGYNAPGEFQ